MKIWNSWRNSLWFGFVFLMISASWADPDPLAQLIKEKQLDQQDSLIFQRMANESYRSTGESSSSSRAISKSDADELLSNAMGLLGVAYRFGGTSPTTGMDCSGFMQYIFRKTFAINLPRTSAEQAQMGTYVPRAELQKGDLVFFRTAGNRISHVGMYIGNNRFIHAPRTGKSIEITSLSNSYWNSKYATARRVKRHNADRFTK